MNLFPPHITLVRNRRGGVDKRGSGGYTPAMQEEIHEPSSPPNPMRLFVSPRAGAGELIAHEGETTALLVSGIAGIVLALAGASVAALESGVQIGYMIFFCMVAGPFLGWTFVYFFSISLSFIGEWLGGIGMSDPIRVVLAWCMIPWTLALVLSGLLGDLPGVSPLSAVLSLYVLWVFLVGLSVAQRVSLLRSLLSILILAVLVAAPLVFFILPTLLRMEPPA